MIGSDSYDIKYFKLTIANNKIADVDELKTRK